MNEIKIHFIVDMNESSAQFCPQLGVGYLAAYLRAKIPGIQIGLSYLSDDIESDIERSKPHIIAISSTSRYFLTLQEIAGRLKEKFKLPIIWGGVHITIAPHELPRFVDVGVLGEGEETLMELLQCFDSTGFQGLEKVKGIVYHQNGSLVKTEKRLFIEPLDVIPHPDTKLFRVPWSKQHRAVIMTSRGCPFKCRFCASSLFWDRTRLHTPEYVVAEMEQLVSSYNITEILIYDDFFTINKQRVARIVELIKGNPLLRGLTFECLSRVDNFTKQLAVQLKEMGVTKISFGMESGCQETLNYLKNKTITLEQIRRAVAIAKAQGIEAVGTFVIGSPFETAADIEETLAFIKSLHLDSVQITVATPFPGTQLWEDGKRLGKIKDDTWSDDYYVLFAWAEDFLVFEKDLPAKVAAQFQGKKLLTQIDREMFLDLVAKAIRLQFQINFRGKQLVFELIKRFMPDSFIKIARRLLTAYRAR
jgi:radical SAM superfamily enzyme YgiQ (UPF0313 family)